MPITLAPTDQDIKPKTRKRRTPAPAVPSIVTLRYRRHGLRSWDALSGIHTAIEDGFLT